MSCYEVTYLILISQDYPNLARFELEQLLGVNLTPYVQGYFLTDNEIDFTLVKRLGLTKEIYKVKKIFTTAREDIVLDLIDKSVFENTYKIDIIGLEGITKQVKPFADKIHDLLESPIVNIKNPDNIYVFFWSLTEVRLCKLIFTNEDDPHNRRSHLKKYNHPTSIHPKIAKAMINIGAKKEFIDPFCGAGGIVIEGALIDLDVKGYDIDELMIKRARENSKEFELDITFDIKDALKLDETTECIITDLPYGKNSKITEEILNLYRNFFKVADKLTNKLVVGMHEDTDIEAYLDDTQWDIKKQFNIYIHKSMTRTITYLEKDISILLD